MLSLCLTAALLAAAPTSPTAPPSPTSAYALVVTNNRSLDATRPDLHYADDDGAKYAELFTEALGRDRVTLLTDFDAESRALFPAWAEGARAPSWENVTRAVDGLTRALERDRAAGLTTEVILVFAGHGDMDRGQGYVELSDGRLTARDLEEKVIDRLPATRVHVILDSCNSYFMLNPRKPGGQRWASSAAEPQGLLARHPNVGALVSTSAEAVTYEWSELQSGIFSYEVRSGLRGAADADGDGRVSYAELTAFINVANRPVPNDLYRPKIFSAPPNHDARAALLAFGPTRARTLQVPAESQRRFTIRDSLGVRLLDVNKESGTALALRLPTSERLTLYETVTEPGAMRPWVKLRTLDFQGAAQLDALRASPSELASRGEAPVFESLFSAPFGQVAFKDQVATQAISPPPPSGITLEDAEHLRIHLRAAASEARKSQLLKGANALASGVTVSLLTMQALPSDTPGGRTTQIVTGSVLGGALAITGGLVFLIAPKEVALLRDFERRDLSTETSRAATVTYIERQLRVLADSEHRARQVASWTYLAGGAVMGVAAALQFNIASFPQLDAAARTRSQIWGAIDTGVAAAWVLSGVLNFLIEAPAETAWKLYLTEPSVVAKPRPSTQPGVTLRVAPTLMGSGGGLVLGGTF